MVHAEASRHDTDREISAFLAQKAEIAKQIAPAASDLVTEAVRYTRGGKRFRARLVAAGFDCASQSDTTGNAASSLPYIEAAIELFHAAALMHDDIIDASATRRGKATSHIEFASLHRTRSFAGDAEKFGESAAILLGDLLLMWSDELFDRGLSYVPDSARERAKSLYHRMREDVTMGQYLDVEAESSWPTTNPAERLERAYTVLTYKSAKYSVEAPLVLGAIIGGADSRLLDDLSGIALPIGIAFQLRDDILGIAGDPARTGKPSGDDIRSGKRTVLLALAESALDAAEGLGQDRAAERQALGAALGHPDASEQDVERARAVFETTGALAQTEERIRAERESALRGIRALAITPSATATLERLAIALTERAQ